MGQNEEIDDVIESSSLIFNNQLKFFDDCILNNKPLSPSSLSTSKPGSSSTKSSSISIQFLPQESTAETVKLAGTTIKIPTPKKVLTRLFLKISTLLLLLLLLLFFQFFKNFFRANLQ